jgi:protein involved in polysaccharide export with SLBB domain
MECPNPARGKKLLRTGRSIFWLQLAPLLVAGGAPAQTTEDYVLGVDKRLEIKVHVLGEVSRPGEYQVADDTNVLELISKAGGPTEFANIKSVILKREPEAGAYTSNEGRRVEVPLTRQVIKVNLKSYLDDEKAAALPVLHPGDVVAVPRNTMHRWKTIFGMVRDLSVVASAYFLYERTFNQK